jgi:hypothetical protein
MKSCFAQKRGGIDQFGGFDSGRQAKEAIHQPKPESRVPSLPPGGWFPEIGQQPVGAGSSGASEFCHDRRERSFREAVENEMSHDQVVRAGGQFRGTDILWNETDTLGGEPFSGEVNHAGAGLEAIDRCLGMEFHELLEEATIALAEDENPGRRIDLPNECGARLL